MSLGVTPPRQLNSDETRVLEALLSLDFPEADVLRGQLSTATVVGQCECGSATVDLQVSPNVLPASAADGPIPAEATVLDEEGNRIAGVIVFVKEGYLSMLEVYMFGNEPVRTWPPSNRLQLEVRGRRS